MSTPDVPVPADLLLRLVLAVERVVGELSGLRADVQSARAAAEQTRADMTAHRVEVKPVLEAHAAYVAALTSADNAEAAEAIAARKSAGDRAAAAKAEEDAARAAARTQALTWAARILVPLLAAALGAGGYGVMSSPSPAQDAPGVTP